MNIEQKIEQLNEKYKELDEKKDILLKELVEKGEDYIFELLEKNGIRCITDIDDELSIWWEYAKNNGWSFSEAINVISSQKYMEEHYEYIFLEDGIDYPYFLDGFNSLEQLAGWIIEYLY